MALTGSIGDHYEIVELLGSGAMGEVYRAIDRKMFDRPVAIKVLTEKMTESEEGRARFRREIETAARLNHPNIVTIHAWGEHAKRDYFVMELIDGRDLHGLLRERVDWDRDRRLDVAAQIADALGAAHARGVIHRDIKPANVMVMTPEADPKVKLVDFGIAHVERSGLTRTEHQPGTYAYMAPEQLRGQSVDARSDLFSLGILLCELFSGHHPFEAESEALITTRVLTEDPDPPSTHVPDLPEALERLLVSMLAKHSEDRPENAAAVAAELRRIARGAGGSGGEVERELAGGLIDWARQKESERSWEDALAAYRRVLPLVSDPNAVSAKIAELEATIARDREAAEVMRRIERQIEAGRPDAARELLRQTALAGDDPLRVEAERLISESATQDSAARERGEFVSARMGEVDEALERGESDRARTLLTELLRRYPDEKSAAALLNRLIDITRGGVDYKRYRVLLQHAREAIARDELESARAELSRARELWPEGPELDERVAEVDRAAEELRRRDEQARAEAERAERREREVLDQYLGGARDLLRDARSSLQDSPQEPQRAVRALKKTVQALDLVLAERPDHTDAGSLRDDVLAEIDALEARREPQPAAAPVPESTPSRRTPLLAAALVVLLAVGAGAAIWLTRGGEQEPGELERILALPEQSLGDVEQKLTQLNAIDALPGLESGARSAIVPERERLEILTGMYTNLNRIEQARRDGDRQAAELIREFIVDARAKLPTDDATASRLVTRAERAVAEIR